MLAEELYEGRLGGDFAQITMEWPVGRGKSLVTWFSWMFPLKQQKDNSSCGFVIGKLLAELNLGRKIEDAAVGPYIKTRYQGIDPAVLAKGVRAMGVECEVYQDADSQELVDILKSGECVAILDIQAPWCREAYARNNLAGHYVLAYGADEEYIYFYDSGNNTRFGKIRIDNLKKIWRDRLIRSGRRMIDGWMLIARVSERWKM